MTVSITGFLLLAGAATVTLLRPDSVALPRADTVLNEIGLGLDQVSVSGQHHTDAADVFDALDLANVPSLIAFDANAARARLSRLPWVETAVITATYPGRLEVQLTERKAFARWRRGETTVLIDATGRVLSAVEPGSYAGLPLVSGEGAHVEAAAILALLARYQPVASRVMAITRVSERRWTLHLVGGVTIHLPADGEAVTLDAYLRLPEAIGLLDTPGSIIDLRAPGRMAVRAPVVAGDPVARVDPASASHQGAP